MATGTEEGVLPTRLPSTVISAPLGVEVTAIMELPAGAKLPLAEDSAGDRLCASLLGSSETGPELYTVNSCPLGTVMSFPFMKRNSGAAGQNTMAVPIMAPVMAPVWPPPW